jgi:hypothetical protein
MTASPYITLAQAKAQLSIDESNTYFDDRIQDLIGAAIDWAENFTNRSLGELLEIDSPADSAAVPLPDPKDSPTPNHFWYSGDWVDTTLWNPDEWRNYWAKNPIEQDQSKALRRDVKAGILLYLETLFDRNIENFALLEKRAQDMLWPYRIALGV